MSPIIRAIAVILFVVIPLLVLAVGQAGLLGGTQPTDLGLRNGLLKAPRFDAWNSVSSQAALHPHTDYHVIAPLAYRGDGKAAFRKRLEAVRSALAA